MNHVFTWLYVVGLIGAAILLIVAVFGDSFKWQNYNEFKNHVRWHDYFALVINEFAVVIVRRYDFDLHDEINSVLHVQILGFTIV